MKDKKIIDKFIENEGINKPSFNDINKNINYDNLDVNNVSKPNFRKVLVLSLSIAVVLLISIVSVSLIIKNNYDKNNNDNKNNNTVTIDKTNEKTDIKTELNDTQKEETNNKTELSDTQKEETNIILEPTETETFESYKLAKEYLSSNNIDATNLSNEDALAIYDDIINEEFSNELTYNLIRNVVSNIDETYEVDYSNLKDLYEMISLGTIESIKDYSLALIYFSDYGLSDTDLSKEEVIAVYEDINSNGFKEPLTIATVTCALTNQLILSPEEVKNGLISDEDVVATWLSYVYYSHENQSYRIEYDYDEENYMINHKYFVSYDNSGNINYKISIYTNAYQIKECDDVCIVYSSSNGCGWSPYLDDTTPDVLIIKKDDGTIISSGTLNNSGVIDTLITIIDNHDGTFSFVSRINYTSLNYRTLNYNYEVLDSKSYDFNENISVSKFGVINDNYLAIVKNENKQEELVFFDSSFNKVSEFTYHKDNYEYRIEDIAILNNKMYLSCTTVYRETPSEDWKYERDMDYISIGDYYEAHDFPLDIERQKEDESVQEYLLSVFDKVYSASLLVYDEEEKCFKEIYTKSMARGSMFYVSSGKLYWSVNELTWGAYCPYFNSHTIQAGAKEFHYIFLDEELVNIEETSNTSIYRIL